MRNLLTKIAWLVTIAGIMVMSLSLKVQHFDPQQLLVEHSEFDPDSIPDHWVDYFLYELADTGEDLPAKNLQPRVVKNTLRKQVTGENLALSFRNGLACIQPYYSRQFEPIPREELIPFPGYYASLSLLHVF